MGCEMSTSLSDWDEEIETLVDLIVFQEIDPGITKLIK